MEVLINLFSQYSIESIILFAMALGVAVKAMSELWEYFYNKLRKYFNYQTKKEQSFEQLTNAISSLHEELTGIRNKEISPLNDKIELAIEKNDEMKNQISLVSERLQENTRGNIIDKHHHFCYVLDHIDDLSLQSLEREYLYYKAAGGDTYVDGLMEDLRALPRLTSYGIEKKKPVYKQEK
jgi:hypothetical protein